MCEAARASLCVMLELSLIGSSRSIGSGTKKNVSVVAKVLRRKVVCNRELDDPHRCFQQVMHIIQGKKPRVANQFKHRDMCSLVLHASECAGESSSGGGVGICVSH